jgi:hypothetical protein
MKLTKILGLATAAAVVLMALAANASATTLEVNGVKRAEPVTILATQSGSLALTVTGGGEFNTCIGSTLEFTVQVFTGSTASGPVGTLATDACTLGPTVVDAAGTLSIEYIPGTTNGTVRSTGAKWTWNLPQWGTVTCTTSNTDLGVLTGTSKGGAVLDINAILNCGFFLPSAIWEGAFVITSPQGLGILS